VKVPAAGTPRPAPIVYLHGGPGVSELPEATAAFGRLAADGYDVYIYDQLGTGRSNRLVDPTGYALARNVADLEAARERIEAERVVLIGHSWGATLAAAYLAAHPARVARVVFSSPGALSLRAYGTAGTGVVDRLPPAGRDRVNALLYQPRATTAWALAQINPRAAHAFAGDRELDARFDRVTSAATPGLFCDTSIAPLPVTGTGFYANQVTLADADAPDPRTALRVARVPALVVKGACDYLPWRFATEYRDTLPGAALVYLPGSGHQAYLDQPAAYFAAVRAFLRDEPPPLPPYNGDAPPPGYAGAR
jgi:proline iminopeptidase